MNESDIQSLLDKRVDCLDLDETRNLAKELQEALKEIRKSHPVAQQGSESNNEHPKWIEAEHALPGESSRARRKGEQVLVYDAAENGDDLLKVRSFKYVEKKSAIIYRLSLQTDGEIHFYGLPDYEKNRKRLYSRIRARSSPKHQLGFDPLPTIFLDPNYRMSLYKDGVEWLFIILPESDDNPPQTDQCDLDYF